MKRDEEDCPICMERKKYDGLKTKEHRIKRLSCCGGFTCTPCYEAMRKDARDKRRQLTCPLCRSLPPNNYEEEFERLLRHAEAGRCWAQIDVGGSYYIGRGTPQSYDRAFHFYSLAAAQGDAHAQTNLAFCYSNGFGVEKSNETAVHYSRPHFVDTHI